ncbi:FemAB family XrtA/PEP-CTERM system-associated protein [Vibrio ziniensis]|uniref:FemAB family PEP-CTERM system-associated protein n=1 Tax=Vibrio ziniensis TaxID=2711221 RepID=A0A6G7CQY7_9VIBR|nr:FemAB family XrtA/PEP-CTERM system-associated protein [Vibrio ziniensis]QIH44499.1 FemAB family PEP-CTERM system-associated protein [Vibrio ziniensis]
MNNRIYIDIEPTIKTATSSDLQLWDEYVHQHPKGSFFHLSGWIKVINGAFQHKHHYIMAVQNEKIVGLLPLFEQKSHLFGHALISTPFCVYGGVIADNQFIERKLEDAAYKLGCQLNVDYIELRDREYKESYSPWVEHCHHSTFSCGIADTPEEILTAVKRKQRAVIRHSLNNNLHWDNSPSPELCYDVYAESVRNLGTPVFNKKLFTLLTQVFGEQCETLIIRTADNTPISSVLSFYYKDEVLPYYGGGTLDARALKSNDFMYYQLMCIARNKGNTKFDFGRSKQDSGSYNFKKNWGMQEEHLHYRIALIKSQQAPNLSPNNPKYKYFIAIWQKLPLSLSRLIGPYLSKYLG